MVSTGTVSNNNKPVEKKPLSTVSACNEYAQMYMCLHVRGQYTNPFIPCAVLINLLLAMVHTNPLFIVTDYYTLVHTVATSNKTYTLISSSLISVDHMYVMQVDHSLSSVRDATVMLLLY